MLRWCRKLADSFHVVGYGCEIYVLRVRFDVCCVVVVLLKYVFFIMQGGSGCIRNGCNGWYDSLVFSFS